MTTDIELLKIQARIELDKLADKAEPMAVTVDGERVTVRKGDDVVTTGKGK